ncbi:hypothetical protein ACOSQ2_004727 [Xanthoceras sorbifolium]
MRMLSSRMRPCNKSWRIKKRFLHESKESKKKISKKIKIMKPNLQGSSLQPELIMMFNSVLDNFSFDWRAEVLAAEKAYREKTKHGKRNQKTHRRRNDKPRKSTYVWEEISSGNTGKAFWRSYETSPMQPWPIMSTG